MDALKKLASVFVQIDDEAEEGAKPKASGAPAAAAATPAPLAPAPLLSAASAEAGTDAKFSERLSKALEENNLEGIDFFEFRRTLDALVGVIGDEPTRYRAAFGSLVAQGAKGENLVQTADHYLQVLDRKELSFGEYIEGQKKERIQSKLNEADRFKAQIQEKSQQIAKLTQDIGELTRSEVEARNAAALARSEIDALQAAFASTKTRFVSDIRAIQERIRQYVLNPPPAQ
jgi:hypothetical protein